MVRSLRIECPGAVHHVTSRGDRCKPIAKDDGDRAVFLGIVGQALARFDAQAWACCLMGNHYHLLLRTRKANLSRLMRQINGVYTQAFNRRHGLAGHLFQGRFNAILVDGDSYLLEVCRYVDLNPVRAAMVERPDDYPWSSYRALAGLADKPVWLDTSSVYAQLAPGKSAIQAAARYADFVTEGKDVQLWADHLRQQIYLGDDAFIARMQKQAGLETANPVSQASGRKSNVSKIHTNIPTHDSDVKRYAAMKFTSKDQRNQNIVNAFYQGGHSQTALALAFGISSSTVSRVVMGYENGV